MTQDNKNQHFNQKAEQPSASAQDAPKLMELRIGNVRAGGRLARDFPRG